MMRFILFVLASFLLTTGNSQSSIFGPKGGLTLGVQSWDGFQRQPILSYHGALFIEGYKEESLSSLFAQIGLHNRGSSERVFFLNGSSAQAIRQNFKFSNAALLLGAKRRFSTSGKSRPYYSFGVRLEYTLGTNLDETAEFAGYFPIEGFVNKFNYGASVSFGYEFPFSEFVGGLIEATVSPDFSHQYQQPGGISVISPITGQAIALREQQIRNITFELTVGFRFLHKVIYLDDY